MSCSIGIDIGGTKIKAAIVNHCGELINSGIFQTESAESYSKLISQLTVITRDLLQSDESGSVKGIGIGVAGLMDKECTTIQMAPNISILNGKHLAADLERESGLSTRMDNDANCMAIGEGVCGAAQGCEHYIAVTLGTGVGGAIFSGGVLIRGISGGGGEIGHIPIHPDGPVCGCGARGCLEAYVGTEAIRKYVVDNYTDLNERSIKNIHTMAEQGNPDAMQVFRYVGKMLGIGLSGLVNIFNPELILVGGGISAAGDLLFNSLREELTDRAFKAYTQVLMVKPAQLGNWAGVVGASRLHER